MSAEKMRRVLIVDDEIGVRESLRLLLKNDYEVFLANDAEEAFSQIKKHTPEVILLDITLPDLDGFKALERIKQNDPNIIVIVVTGTMTTETALKAKELDLYPPGR
jgi:DNA-binding NtrC family response regulator